MSSKVLKKSITPQKTKEIKKKLIDKDIQITDLAKEIQVSQPFISMVIRGQRKSKKVISYLEKKLGVRLA